MIESVIQTKASATSVWRAWSKAHGVGEGVVKTEKGKKIPYRIVDVQEGKSFSILWKSLFVRMTFIHDVSAKNRGAEIRYRVQIQGFLAWPVRLILSSKIERNLEVVLKALVKELEESKPS